MALARPTQKAVPFANSGVKNAIPETATGSNLASLQEGFPTVTMTDVDYGGMPPQGQDMNGILFDVTTAIRYQQAGGLFPYDATFAAAIDGYPLGAILTATDGSCLYQNTVSGNQTDPENGGTGWSQILSSASIAGKQDKLSPVQMDAVNSGITAARVAIYDGYAAGKQNTLTFDNAPTNGSSNPVTSDGIYAALGTKQDTITVDAVPSSGSTNPVQSGGVYDALAEKVNIDNAGNAEVIATGSAESRTLSAWMADVTEKIDKNPYKKRIVANLPFHWSDYDTCLALTGSSYLYPQGFQFDSEGNLYINYVPSTTDSGIGFILKYNSSFNYVGYCQVVYGVETMVIREQGGSKFLYNRSSLDSALYRYDITNNAWGGETLTGTKVLNRIGQEFAYDSGRWIASVIDADMGNAQSRTFFIVYDDNFNPVSSMTIPRSVVGWSIPEFSYYYYVPKMQGFAVSGDRVFVSQGASYIPSRESHHMAGDIGVTELTMEGTIVRSSLLNCDSLISRLNGIGINAQRTEAEGVVVKDGDIYSLYVVSLLNDTTGGVLIVKEFADDGEDFSDIASSYVPFNAQRFINGTYPTFYEKSIADGGVRVALNPVTGEKMTTLVQLMEFMLEYQLPRTSFYTSIFSFTPPSGFSFPSSSLVEVLNASNQTFLITVKESGSGSGVTFYSFNKNANTGLWNGTNITNFLRTSGGTVDGQIISTRGGGNYRIQNAGSDVALGGSDSNGNYGLYDNLNSQWAIGFLPTLGGDFVVRTIGGKTLQGNEGGGLEWDSTPHSQFSLPDKSTFENVTLPANTGTYTAPYDGFLNFMSQSTDTNQFLRLDNGNMRVSSYSSATSQNLAIGIPCKKGDEITVRYTAALGSGNSNTRFRFFRNVGALWEA